MVTVDVIRSVFERESVYPLFVVIKPSFSCDITEISDQCSVCRPSSSYRKTMSQFSLKCCPARPRCDVVCANGFGCHCMVTVSQRPMCSCVLTACIYVVYWPSLYYYSTG